MSSDLLLLVGMMYLLLALMGVFMLEVGRIISFHCCLLSLFFKYTGSKLDLELDLLFSL